MMGPIKATSGMGAIRKLNRMGLGTDTARRRMGKSMMPLLIIAPLRPGIQSELLLPRARVLFKGASIQSELLLPHPIGRPRTRAVWGIRRQFLPPPAARRGDKERGRTPLHPL